MSRSKEQGRPIAELITSTGQYAAASINYRLTQHAFWPAQIFDCKAAVRYLRANADKFGIDPDRIAVMGHSAGGHLTAHGTADGLVPLAQAEELNAALKKANIESHLIAMRGAGHGFANDELNQRVKTFLDLHLRQIPGKISDSPISVR